MASSGILTDRQQRCLTRLWIVCPSVCVIMHLRRYTLPVGVQCSAVLSEGACLDMPLSLVLKYPGWRMPLTTMSRLPAVPSLYVLRPGDVEAQLVYSEKTR